MHGLWKFRARARRDARVEHKTSSRLPSARTISGSFDLVLLYTHEHWKLPDQCPLSQKASASEKSWKVEKRPFSTLTYARALEVTRHIHAISEGERLESRRVTDHADRPVLVVPRVDAWSSATLRCSDVFFRAVWAERPKRLTAAEVALRVERARSVKLM